jgi:hypothetical protein
MLEGVKSEDSAFAANWNGFAGHHGGGLASSGLEMSSETLASAAHRLSLQGF